MAQYQRKLRTEEELNKICGDSFKAVTIPDHWKFKQYERVRLTDETDSEIQCIAAIFVDKNTNGFNLTHYRLNFHTYSERLSITEVTFADFGKQNFLCLTENNTPEKINEYITLKLSN